jgi:hypothetical protein
MADEHPRTAEWREKFTREPLDQSNNANIDQRVANALEYIAYQLWSINLHLGRMDK